MILLNPRRRRRLQWALIALALYLFIYRPYFSPSSSGSKSSHSTSTSNDELDGPDPFIDYPLYDPDQADYHPPNGRKSRSSKHPKSAQTQQSVSMKTMGMVPTGEGHQFHAGLIVTDLSSDVHPITKLIQDAQKRWSDKIGGGSSSLAQAAAVYQGRYGRPAPKGFDKWWHYVCEHNVALPDEYDQINKDMYHFRALSPSRLNRDIQETSKRPDTWTLSIKNGEIATHETFSPAIRKGGEQRMANQLELLRPVVKDIGDLEMVFNVHDTPQSFVSFSYKNELVDFIEDRAYDEDDYSGGETGWSSACTTSSPGKRFDFDSPPDLTPPTEKTFVVSLPALLDLCQHPYQVPIHGVLGNKKPTARNLIPLVSISKSILHSDILAVAAEAHMDSSKAANVSWDQKTEDKLLWRGSNTGMHYDKKSDWRESHRARLIRDFAVPGDEAKGEEIVTILPPAKGVSGTLGRSVQKITRREANEYYMDVGFTGTPIQCDKNDGTCDELARDLKFGVLTHDRATQAKRKFLLDVDGNAWSSRFEQLLLTGSVIIKNTVMPEWWSDRIQPWVHYIPIQTDYSDLYDVLAYFRGDTSGQGGNDRAARAIGDAGKEFAQKHWRKEDMTAYMFRLYLEWARLISPDRKGMDFVYDPKMERAKRKAL